MNFFELFSLILVLTSLIGLINFRFIKLPTSIGIMLVSLVLSFVLVVIGQFYPLLFKQACAVVDEIQFSEFLLEIILSFMLFTGAFTLDSKLFQEEIRSVLLFATLGVLISTIITGILLYFLLPILGISMELIYCLLFGALISPTDPIAVHAVIKKFNIPKSVAVDIEGESLFNDGVAVVLFVTILGIAENGIGSLDIGEVSILFLWEVLGGVMLGFVSGYIGSELLQRVNVLNLDVLITLSIVMGGYSLASLLHVSGPIAVVVAGLFLSHKLIKSGFAIKTKVQIQIFWDIINDILNYVLFFLIGLEVISISHDFESSFAIAGIVAFGVILLSRLLSVSMLLRLTRKHTLTTKNAIALLTWGGLRGGISIAMALSLTEKMHEELIVSLTYVVVLLSILFQGLTIKALLDKMGLGPVGE